MKKMTEQERQEEIEKLNYYKRERFWAIGQMMTYAKQEERARGLCTKIHQELVERLGPANTRTEKKTNIPWKDAVADNQFMRDLTNMYAQRVIALNGILGDLSVRIASPVSDGNSNAHSQDVQ